MRTRRHFQPTLDEMPSRIAPSAVGGLPHVAVLAHVSSSSITMESAMPPTGTSSPLLAGPPPSSPSPTILC